MGLQGSVMSNFLPPYNKISHRKEQVKMAAIEDMASLATPEIDPESAARVEQMIRRKMGDDAPRVLRMLGLVTS